MQSWSRKQFVQNYSQQFIATNKSAIKCSTNTYNRVCMIQGGVADRTLLHNTRVRLNHFRIAYLTKIHTTFLGGVNGTWVIYTLEKTVLFTSVELFMLCRLQKLRLPSLSRLTATEHIRLTQVNCIFKFTSYFFD